MLLKTTCNSSCRVSVHSLSAFSVTHIQEIHTYKDTQIHINKNDKSETYLKFCLFILYRNILWISNYNKGIFHMIKFSEKRQQVFSEGHSVKPQLSGRHLFLSISLYLTICLDSFETLASLIGKICSCYLTQTTYVPKYIRYIRNLKLDNLL